MHDATHSGFPPGSRLCCSRVGWVERERNPSGGPEGREQTQRWVSRSAQPTLRIAAMLALRAPRGQVGLQDDAKRCRAILLPQQRELRDRERLPGAVDGVEAPLQQG